MAEEKGKCKFCNTRKCFMRIVCEIARYDEVACAKHAHNLEMDADMVLKDKPRCHYVSSHPLKRESINPFGGGYECNLPC